MSSFTSALQVAITDQTRKGRMQLELTQPFQYYRDPDHSEIIEVPTGFVTDLASVPRGLWVFWPPLGRYSKAAVLHDFLYARPESGRASETRPDKTRRICDTIFLEAMRVCGVSGLTRLCLYGGVRLFGGGSWRKCRRGN